MVQEKSLTLFFGQLKKQFMHRFCHFSLDGSMIGRNQIVRHLLHQIEFFTIPIVRSTPSPAHQHIIYRAA